MIELTAWLPYSASLLLLLHATTVVGLTPTVPDLPFTINVDSPSTHPHNLTILQPSRSTLRKRAPSRPLNNCPEPSPSLAPSVFLHSRCNRTHNALAYEITCSEIWTIDRQLADHEPVHDSDYDDDGEWINDGSRGPDDDIRDYDETQYPHDKTHQLSCDEHEICVDGFRSVDGRDGAVAYCVATENFRKIAADRVTHVEAPMDTTDIVASGSGAAGAGSKRKRELEIVLTKPDHMSTMYAKKMRVLAQTFDEMYGTRVWRTVKDGRMDCKTCPQLGPKPMPVGTRRLHVDLMLSAMDLAEGGFMYIFDV